MIYHSKFSDSWRPRGWVARWRLTSASFPPLCWASPLMSPNTPWWGESKCRLPTQQPLLSWKLCPSLWAPGTYNRSIRKYSNKIQAYPQNTTYQKNLTWGFECAPLLAIIIENYRFLCKAQKVQFWSAKMSLFIMHRENIYSPVTSKGEFHPRFKLLKLLQSFSHLLRPVVSPNAYFCKDQESY